jgi:hypothetical protein
MNQKARSATAAAPTMATGTAIRTADDFLPVLPGSVEPDGDAEACGEVLAPAVPDEWCWVVVAVVGSAVAPVVAVYESPTLPMMVCAMPADTVTRGPAEQSHWPLEEPVAQQYVSPPQFVMSPYMSEGSA